LLERLRAFHSAIAEWPFAACDDAQSEPVQKRQLLRLDAGLRHPQVDRAQHVPSIPPRRLVPALEQIPLHLAAVKQELPPLHPLERQGAFVRELQQAISTQP